MPENLRDFEGSPAVEALPNEEAIANIRAEDIPEIDEDSEREFVQSFYEEPTDIR